MPAPLSDDDETDDGGADDGGADTSGGSGPTVGKGRTEALSDGVFGFAMTLLVVDLAVHPPGSPLDQFLAAWPAYLVYVVSFLTIGGGWLGHNALTDDVRHVDRLFLRVNLLLLMLVAFLPFPTRLVELALRQGSGAERVAAVVYGLSLLAIRLLYGALAYYSQVAGLRVTAAEGADMRESGRKFRVAVGSYLVAILLSLLVPTVAVAVYLVVAIFLFVPFRAIIEQMRALRANRS